MHAADFRALPLHLKFVHSVKIMSKRRPLVLYATAHVVVLGFAYAYRAFVDRKLLLERANRFRVAYTIYRPDDPKVKIIPARHIADRKYLPPDHPEKLEDRKIVSLPYIAFRESMRDSRKDSYG